MTSPVLTSLLRLAGTLAAILAWAFAALSLFCLSESEQGKYAEPWPWPPFVSVGLALIAILALRTARRRRVPGPLSRGWAGTIFAVGLILGFVGILVTWLAVSEHHAAWTTNLGTGVFLLATGILLIVRTWGVVIEPDSKEQSVSPDAMATVPPQDSAEATETQQTVRQRLVSPFLGWALIGLGGFVIVGNLATGALRDWESAVGSLLVGGIIVLIGAYLLNPRQLLRADSFPGFRYTVYSVGFAGAVGLGYLISKDLGVMGLVMGLFIGIVYSIAMVKAVEDTIGTTRRSGVLLVLVVLGGCLAVFALLFAVGVLGATVYKLISRQRRP